MIVVDEDATLNETMQQMLLDFTNNGGTLLIFNDENTDNYLIYNNIGIRRNDFDENKTRVEYVAQRNSFFDDVFVKFPDNAELPAINKHVRFETSKNVQNIIALQNGDPLLMMTNNGKGKIFVMSTSLSEEYSDVANHALFVPLMYKMALIGGNVSELSYTLGVDKMLNINDVSLSSDDRVCLRTDNGLYEMFPLIENRGGRNYLNFFEDLPSSGFYDIYKNNDYVKTVAWNDNRKESMMSFYDKEELNKLLRDNGLNVLAMIDDDEMNSDDMMAVIVKDTAVWKIFVIVALIALLMEILILRFWK